jgi:hypothetical protein
MVEQLLLNTNEILQCATVPNSEFSTAKFGQLNIAMDPPAAAPGRLADTTVP